MELAKLIIQFIIALLGWHLDSQPVSYDPHQWYDTINKINADTLLSGPEKVQRFEALLADFEQQNLPHDSIYALFYHRMGLCETEPQQKISYSEKSLLINNAGNRTCSVAFTGKTYRNIALTYYYEVQNNMAAIRYYDSAIQVCSKYYEQRSTEFFQACDEQCEIHLKEGDFAEVLDRLNIVVARRNTPQFAGNESSLANVYMSAATAAGRLKKYTLAKQYIRQAEEWWTADRNLGKWVNCQVITSDIAGLEERWSEVESYLSFAILRARQVKDSSQMIDVLSRFGFLYLQSGKYAEALKPYHEQLKLIHYTSFTEENKVSLYNNLGAIYDRLQKPFEALDWVNKALGKQLGPYACSSVLQNPTLEQLISRPNKSAAFPNLQNKGELLLHCYRLNGDARLLVASEQAFFLAEQLLTYMRQNQTEEESQLLWREKSRSFYEQALEMCYEKHDNTLAYQYLEKSRAALLNGRLNELGAAATLPADLQQKEADLALTVFKSRQHLLELQPQDKAYGPARQQFDDAVAAQQRFIKSLEKTHPAYHTYRYTTSVPPLDDLKRYLTKNKQQWVQYFLKDSLLFVLYANGDTLLLHRLVVHDMQQLMPRFLQQCTDREHQLLKSFRREMHRLSHSIYDTLLGSLPLQPGRLIISPDNSPIPFDALCTDTATSRYLIQDFAVSYAYSANFLLKQYQQKTHSGKFFLGMAPVQFPAVYHLTPLEGSEEALRQTAANYTEAQVITRATATRQAFFTQLPKYTIATLYAHAQSGDTTEPRFFMADSTIRLSELQTIRNPATQMMVLNACETAAGRLASGEGVFSIARGFAMAGIPCTVATLWKANADPMYYISNRFHYYLSNDSTKDVALRLAKLDYMQSQDEDLPFYWANMTLTGNAEALQHKPSNYRIYWGMIALLTGCAVAIIWYWFRSRRRMSKALKSRLQRNRLLD